MTTRTLLAALALVGALATVARAAEDPVEAKYQALVSELRCPVCQNLSVGDSPSDMAKQMRDLVHERLRQGESPEAVKAYLVERYGEWILLVPPARGFSLVAWVAPFLALVVGLGAALLVLSRWAKRTKERTAEVDPQYLLRVREELEHRREV